MERVLHFFLVMHIKREIPSLSEELNQKALIQWALVEKEALSLPVPRRAYFDSLHFRNYKEEVANADKWIKESRSTAGLTPCQRMKVFLRSRGVEIEPTESPTLMREYETIDSYMEECKRLKKRPEIENPWDIVDRRDKYIAKRIHKTLRKGEFAFLFLGINHFPERSLRSDITLHIYWGNVEPKDRRQLVL